MNWREIWIDPKTNRLRCGWRVLIFLPLAVLFWGMLSYLYIDTVDRYLHVAKPFQFYVQLLAVDAIGAFVFISLGILALRVFEHLPAQTLGLPLRGTWLQTIAIGFVLGIGLITILAFALRMTGFATFTWHHPGSHALTMLGVAVLGALIVGLMEETVFRGYLFQTLLRGIGPIATLGITSALFACMHLGNDNITLLGLANIFLAGVMLGMLYLRIGTLWLPIGLHAGWNFGQLLFGLPISGEKIPLTTPFTGVLHGATWLTGGNFGLEGGVGASILMLAVIAIVTYSRRGLPLESQWWEWRELIPSATPSLPWDLTVDTRYYQWKLLEHETGNEEQ